MSVAACWTSQFPSLESLDSMCVKLSLLFLEGIKEKGLKLRVLESRLVLPFLSDMAISRVKWGSAGTSRTGLLRELLQSTQNQV